MKPSNLDFISHKYLISLIINCRSTKKLSVKENISYVCSLP
ncbi:hypothetical protein J2S16_003225 [Cytobacillus kochii]|nr:hypothetical protein [Cytobacillus kochii]